MTPTQITSLARGLMNEHGLGHWTLELSRAKRIMGQCDHRNQRIRLSEPLLTRNGEDQARDTILHEIAHALVGPGAGHGPRWKIAAKRLGAEPTACASGPVEPVPHAWHITCRQCHAVVAKRHRRPPASWFARRMSACCRERLALRRAAVAR